MQFADIAVPTAKCTGFEKAVLSYKLWKDIDHFRSTTLSLFYIPETVESDAVRACGINDGAIKGRVATRRLLACGR